LGCRAKEKKITPLRPLMEVLVRAGKTLKANQAASWGGKILGATHNTNFFLLVKKPQFLLIFCLYGDH
jgi:hypothetical protein